MPNITVPRSSNASSSSPHPQKNNFGGSSDGNLAARRADSRSGESPDEYRERVESEKAAASQTTRTNVKIEKISPQDNVPSPVAPGYRDQYLKDQEAKKQQQTSRTITPEEKQAIVDRYDSSPLRPDKVKDKLIEAPVFNPSSPQTATATELRRNVVQSQIDQTAANTPFLKTQEQQLREAEQKEQAAAMNLGKFEPYASKYESRVSNFLSPLTGSSVSAARFAGGFAEAIAFTPTAIPRVIVGLGRDPGATVQGVVQGIPEQVIADPARGLGQVAGMVVGGKALAKGGSAIKSKLPAVATGEQGFLVKTKVLEIADVPEPGIKPTIQAEYRGSAFGIDNFDITKFNNEIAPLKPTNAAGREIFVGETRNSLTDIYFKLDSEQAAQLSQRYTGNVRNIKTPEGSFVEFEPTGKIEPPIYERSGARIPTAEPELIGKMPGSNVKPFGTEGGASIRLEKRVNLQKGDLSLSNSNRQLLPEFTTTIEGRGKVVTDFDINEFYGPPATRDPLQLESGVSIIEAQRKGFFASEEAILNPRKQVREYKKPTFIGEMQEVAMEKPVI